MKDRYEQAMKRLEELALPEPDKLTRVQAGGLRRIEINYHRPGVEVANLDWVPSSTGTHEFVEMVFGGVLVSIYAERSKVTA